MTLVTLATGEFHLSKLCTTPGDIRDRISESYIFWKFYKSLV
jgi:hypothetical protein